MIYFEVPTRIKFYNDAEEKYVAGVAYEDKVICGCCGGIIEIRDICNNCPEGTAPFIVRDDWAKPIVED